MDNHDQLQRVLAIKRHEAPSPSYFSHFSDQVIARIEHQEQMRRVSFFRGLASRIDLRPILACAFGGGLAGLMLGLIVWGSASPHHPRDRSATAPQSWLTAAVPEAHLFRLNHRVPSEAGSSVAPVIHLPKSAVAGRSATVGIFVRFNY